MTDAVVVEIRSSEQVSAARRLVQLVQSPDEKVSLAAIDQIFNRIYGRPVQQVDAEVRTTSVQQAHLQILLERRFRLRLGRGLPSGFCISLQVRLWLWLWPLFWF